MRGPNGQTGTVIGGFADFRYDKTPTMGQPEQVTAVVVQPNIEEGTSGAPAIAEGPTSPSPALSDVDPERAVKAAQTEGHASPDSGARRDMLHNMAAQTPSRDDVTSSEDEVKTPEYQDLPTPGRQIHPKRSKKVNLKKDQWEGEVCGQMHTDRDALLKIIQRVKAVEQRVLEEDVEEVEADNEISADEWADGVEGAAVEPKTDLAATRLRSGKFVCHINKRETIGG